MAKYYTHKPFHESIVGVLGHGYMSLDSYMTLVLLVSNTTVPADSRGKILDAFIAQLKYLENRLHQGPTPSVADIREIIGDSFAAQGPT